MNHDDQIALMIFTRDLRVEDNPALSAASRGSKVVCAFVHDDVLRSGIPMDPRRKRFLAACLADLDGSLRGVGSRLEEREGDWVDEVLRLVAETGARTIHVADDVTPYARRRFSRLEAAARRSARVCRAPGLTIVPPGVVRPAGGDHYRVFTPYFRRWSAFPRRPLIGAPTTMGALQLATDTRRSRPRGPGSRTRPGARTGGERAAKARLAAWSAGAIACYGERRDDLGEPATSRLSTDLHFGCLSPLAVESAMVGRPGSVPFLRQLCWRDFYLQLLAARPDAAWSGYLHGSGRAATDGPAFEAWRSGRTGVPIVDAAMRQLADEGFMPNRARMIAASFLTRNLGADWRDGARHFLEHLVDADVALNNLNWQWVTGLGTGSHHHRVLALLVRHDGSTRSAPTSAATYPSFAGSTRPQSTSPGFSGGASSSDSATRSRSCPSARSGHDHRAGSTIHVGLSSDRRLTDATGGAAVSIEHASSVDHPIDMVFGWHERPGAFARLAPPWQPVHLVEEAGSLAHGEAVIGLPGGIRWVARHGDYDPPHGFTDDLVSLPLPWHHVHSFSPEGPSRTRVTDSVTTPVPASLLRRTFVYRHAQLRDDLRAVAELRRRDPTPRTFAVTGSSGLVGSALCAFLSTAGHQVVRLVRRPPRTDDERGWDPGDPDPAVFEDVDAVVHLAGASIAGRFSEEHKRAIASSRIEPTRRLVEAVVRSGGPRVVVAASAIGYYGPDRGDELLDETAGRGSGFLADVVEKWEAATRPAADAGLRVVTVRTGVVVSARGGMLRLLRPVFLAGLGGPVGAGRQWLSWIDLDDLTDVYARAVVDRDLEGVLNAVAPLPVRNKDFVGTLGHVLRRPALLPVPTPALGAVVGAEGVHEVACASQRVVPRRLEALDFRFRRPHLEASLRHQLGRFDPGR